MIVDVAEDPRAWEPFLALAERLYRGDPRLAPMPRAGVQSELGRAGFLGRQRVLAAMEEGRAVARVAARISPTLQDDDGKPYGLLSVFEAEDRPDAVRELLDDACRWLRHRGARRVIGPIDGDAWHRVGWSVGPWEAPFFWREPVNPPGYGPLWESAGFAPWQHYVARHVPDVGSAAALLAPRIAQIEAKGYRLRTLDRSRFRDELIVLHRLSLEARADALHDEISLAEFSALYESLERHLDPRLVLFAQSADVEDVGFVLAVPDYQRAILAMSGSRGAVARMKFLLHRRRALAANVLSVAVVPAHRRRGIGSALMARCYQAAQARGLRQANLGPIRMGDPAEKLAAGQGSVLRQYVLYRRSV